MLYELVNFYLQIDIDFVTLFPNSKAFVDVVGGIATDMREIFKRRLKNDTLEEFGKVLSNPDDYSESKYLCNSNFKCFPFFV